MTARLLDRALPRARTFTLVAALVSGGAFAACSDSSDDTDSNSGGNGATSAAGGTNAGGSTGTGFETGGNDPNGNDIVITPASFELTVVNGAIVTQALTATLQGQDVTSQVEWAFELPAVGDVNDALFTPTGTVGGSGKVGATLGSSKGEATGTVIIDKTVGLANLTPEQIAALDNPTGGADPALSIVYPLNEVVFPLDVLGPEIMWNGGGGGDVYKLSIDEQFYSYTEYFAAAPPARHFISEQDWTDLSSSGAGAQSNPVSVSLTRLSGVTAFEPVSQTWRIAKGRLKGAVYYWELPDACVGGDPNGRVLKIKPSDPIPEQFYTPGVCWGCHTVSRDGGKMMATLETGSPFPQVTIDLTTTPATPSTITQATGLGGTFSAFNDKGDRIVMSSDGSGELRLRIADANTGQILNNDAMGLGCGEPAWSPDGLKMAAVCGMGNGGWAFDVGTGSLNIADVAADGFTVSNVQTIVPQGSPGRPAYPSFSPGNEYIAFGRPTQGSRSQGAGTLWMTNLDGSEVKQLTAAGVGDQSFNPVFAPLRAGGYYWLVYISRRDYGNRLVNANRQQLWITAITDPPSAADPSSPPFYLRGQEDCGRSENAYFALEPCKEEGEPCTSGVDCCTGTCVKDPDSNEYVCGVPGECAEDGNACEVAADCCDAPQSSCIDGFCEAPIPQ